MKSCIIESTSLICNLGSTASEVLQALDTGTPGPMPLMRLGEREVPVGAVTTPLPSINQENWRTRTNQLLLWCLNQLSHHWKKIPKNRLGIVMGSSNSGIEEYHRAWMQGQRGDAPLHHLEVGNVARFVAEITGATGPSFTISTACSSSAKALASAARLLRADVCDAVIAGGGDALCRYALSGFDALHLISDTRSEPFTMQGGGVNHGEGAALFLLTHREPNAGDIILSGYGETADAYHTTTPEPGGHQATRAMLQAMQMAGIAPQEIDYVNLHGTGTDANDGMELDSMRTTFGDIQPPCGSTKAYTGHTLGAAGALEAAICHALLQRNSTQLPQQPWLRNNTAEGINFGAKARRPVQHCLSNSFAFGGNNISLLLSRHV